MSILRFDSIWCLPLLVRGFLTFVWFVVSSHSVVIPCLERGVKEVVKSIRCGNKGSVPTFVLLTTLVSTKLLGQFAEQLDDVRGVTRVGEIVEVDIKRGESESGGELLDEHAHGGQGGRQRPQARCWRGGASGGGRGSRRGRRRQASWWAMREREHASARRALVGRTSKK
jgi:hypothetical protein